MSGYSRILALVKSGELEHLKDIQEGRLRFRRLDYYSSLENVEKHFGDRDEGLAFRLPASDVIIKLNHPELGTKVVSEETGLVGEVRVGKANASVACMSVMGVPEDWMREISEAELREFREAVMPTERLRGFGSHVLVVLNWKSFVERVIAACERTQLNVRVGLVDYSSISGSRLEIGWGDVGFRKDLRYRDEREFRFLVEGIGLPCPFYLDTGSIGDISMIFPWEEFEKSVELSFRD